MKEYFENMALSACIAFVCFGCSAPEKMRTDQGNINANKPTSNNFSDFIDRTSGKEIALAKNSSALAAKITNNQVIDSFKSWCRTKGGVAGMVGNPMYPTWFCKGDKIEGGVVGLSVRGANYFANPVSLTVHFYSSEQINPEVVSKMLTEDTLRERRQAEIEKERIDKIKKEEVDAENQRKIATQENLIFWSNARRGDKTCFIINPATYDTNDLGNGTTLGSGTIKYTGKTFVTAYIEEISEDNVKIIISGIKFVEDRLTGIPQRTFYPSRIILSDGQWGINSVIWQKKAGLNRC